MKFRPIGKSGIEASVVALGTWGIGGGPNWADTDDAYSVGTIHKALDLGINMIDTAPVYGNGHSEEMVGRALKTVDRSKVILSTKCGWWWKDDRGSEFMKRGDITLRRSLRPDTIREEIEMSLKRLGTDYIDIYFTHWPSIPPDLTPIAETMNCLLDLKKEGKIRAIGISNVTTEQAKEYLDVGQVDVIQDKYSAIDRAKECDLLPLCIEEGMAFMAYSPLEAGLLSGKITMDTPVSVAQGNQPWMKPENRPRALAFIDKLRGLAEKYDCTVAQLAIAFSLEQPGVSHLLLGARRESTIIENVKALDLTLEPADLVRIRGWAEALGTPTL